MRARLVTMSVLLLGAVSSLALLPRTSGPAQAAGDPIVVAAGDIACDPTTSAYNGGAGSGSLCRQRAVADVIGRVNPTMVLALGDEQYSNGSLSTFRTSYASSWGAYLSRTRAVPGNHEYGTSGASGYATYFGSRGGPAGRFYSSFNLGAWHVVALNGNCSSVGGCGATSAQVAWLKQDLAANPRTCTLAFWHQPRFSSGEHGSNAAYGAFWDTLYRAGADVVLSGHDHDYERFATLDPAGRVAANGLRQFVVGTGGAQHYAMRTAVPGSQVRNSTAYGVLQLNLHADSYGWRFQPVAGSSFTDGGLTRCH